MKYRHIWSALSLFALALGASAQPARELMRDVHQLANAHQSIERVVEKLPNGARAVTTSTDDATVAVLQRHVHEMTAHVGAGGRVRMWDPLFAALHEHYQAIDTRIENQPRGVAVTLTSADPAVVALIHAHADKVSDFAARGRAAMREATPLPEAYHMAQGERAATAPAPVASAPEVRPMAERPAAERPTCAGGAGGCCKTMGKPAAATPVQAPDKGSAAKHDGWSKQGIAKAAQ